MDAAAQTTAASQPWGLGGGSLHTKPGSAEPFSRTRSTTELHTPQGQCSALPPVAAAAALFSCTDAARLIQRGCPAGNLTAFLLIYSVQPVSYWDFGFTFTEFPLASLGAKNKANSSLYSCGQRTILQLSSSLLLMGEGTRPVSLPHSDNKKAALPPLHTTVINVVF